MKSRYNSIEETAKMIDNLWEAGKRDVRQACGDYGVNPKDYGRDSDDFSGAWSDYEEDRVNSLLVSCEDPEKAYFEAEHLWMKRHR